MGVTMSIDEILTEGERNQTDNPSNLYIGKNDNFSFIQDNNNDLSKKPNKDNKPQSKNTDIMNTLETILKRLDQLQRDVNQLMERGTRSKEKSNDEILKTLLLNLPNITSIEKDRTDISENENSDTSNIDILKEFLSIYNSSNEKKSISINKELEVKIKELISKHYGITDNDSKIINTALMIALLKV